MIALWTFCAAFIISFLGSLPLGSINMSVLYAALHYNLKFIVISIGLCMLFEGLWLQIVFVTRSYSEYILPLNALNALYAVLLCMLGLIYILKTNKLKAVDAQLQVSQLIILNVLNPFMLPFWLGAITYLQHSHYLGYNFSTLAFTCGACFGAGAALSLYYVVGKVASKQIPIFTGYIQKIIGAIFIITGIVIGYREFV